MRIQSATDKVISSRLKDTQINDKKQVCFKVDEASAKAWVEDDVKNLSKNNGSVGTTFMKEMTKEAQSTPQNIKATINGKKKSNPHK